MLMLVQEKLNEAVMVLNKSLQVCISTSSVASELRRLTRT